MNGCNNCVKRRDIKKECPWGGTYHHRGEHGEQIGICNAYRKETNADRVRAMSDEGLAEWILMEVSKIIEQPIWCDSHCEDGCDHERECVKNWLQQPAPEEGEQNV